MSWGGAHSSTGFRPEGGVHGSLNFDGTQHSSCNDALRGTFPGTAGCGKRADIVKRLNSGFEEQRRSAGLAADGNLVEVFASEQGTWTIIYAQPGGLTCLVAVGDNGSRSKHPSLRRAASSRATLDGLFFGVDRRFGKSAWNAKAKSTK